MKKLLPRKALKVLFVGAEAAPFAKVGGLGEVLRALPNDLRELGVDTRVFLPKYGSIEEKEYPMKKEMELKIASKKEDPHGLLVSNVLIHTAKDKSVTYFLENKECYEKRANVYGYSDDTMRWVLLSRGVLEFVKKSKWKPDIIVANDWQTGFVPNIFKTDYKNDPELKNIKVVFCIHNLRHQGTFNTNFVSEVDADSGQGPIPPFFSPMQNLNGMRRGILSADAVVTVSPTYAQEIVSPEYGEGLDGLLMERRQDLYGIMNGIDATRFDPSTDVLLTARYSARNPDRRSTNKVVLQERFGLTQDLNAMIIGFNGRLDEQKGISLIQPILKSLLDNLSFQFVLLGDGDTKFKLFLKDVATTYPGRVGIVLEYKEELPRLIYAGADVILIPSRFEPSGLVQLEAMRYGAIPLVRKTGGLADTVFDYDPEDAKGNGFVFEKYDPQALLVTIVRAHESFRNKKEWKALVQRAMNMDFSWKNSARKYMALFRKLQGAGESIEE